LSARSIVPILGRRAIGYALELTVEAMKAGHRGVFFTLEYTEGEIVDRLRAIGRQGYGDGLPTTVPTPSAPTAS
jgi:hypothetical protein